MAARRHHQKSLHFLESLAAKGHMSRADQWDKNSPTTSDSCFSGSPLALELLDSSPDEAESPDGFLKAVVGGGRWLMTQLPNFIIETGLSLSTAPALHPPQRQHVPH